jgi:trans-2,3-dihydro-3-hydroxyanthranilate isomerase
MQLKFSTVDVFTDQQFGGNPLAVFPDAKGLSTAQMQAIAAEFNLAETTFVLPPQKPEHTAQVRIFTPRAEMPFAGHPNVGTAFVLARLGECHGRPIGGDTLAFEEIAGLVRMTLLKQGSAIIGAQLAAPQPLVIGDTVPCEVVAEACALDAAAIETRHHQPCIASCGAPFVMAELKSREAARQGHGNLYRRRLRAGDAGCPRPCVTEISSRGGAASLRPSWRHSAPRWRPPAARSRRCR